MSKTAQTFAESLDCGNLGHVAMAFSLLFALRPASEKLAGTKANFLLSVVLIVAVLGASLWLISRWKAIAFSGGLTTDGDFYAGLIILILVFEAARRGVGLILAIITLVFFCYPFISPYLPGILSGRGYSLERMAKAGAAHFGKINFFQRRGHLL